MKEVKKEGFKAVLDNAFGEAVAFVPVGEMLKDEKISEDFKTLTVNLDSKISEKHDLYLVLSGEKYDIFSWKFE